MKQIVNSMGFDQLLKRFYDFADAVIRSITLRYNNDGTRGVDISISTRDSTTQDNEGWVCVIISIDFVLEIAIYEHVKTTIQVLSQGIHISMFDDKVGIEFGGEIEPPKTLVDLRRSDAYALGKTLSFEVFPY